MAKKEAKPSELPIIHKTQEVDEGSSNYFIMTEESYSRDIFRESKELRQLIQATLDFRAALQGIPNLNNFALNFGAQTGLKFRTSIGEETTAVFRANVGKTGTQDLVEIQDFVTIEGEVLSPEKYWKRLKI